jgi:hypothetical protein
MVYHQLTLNKEAEKLKLVKMEAYRERYTLFVSFVLKSKANAKALRIIQLVKMEALRVSKKDIHR